MTATITMTYNGATHIDAEPDWLRSQGVPEAEIAAALAELRARAVSAECRSRIYAEASAEAQMNMATAAAVIGAKTTSQRSADETAILAGAGAALAWVSAMRGAAAELAADTAADYHADDAWPPLDEAVRAMIKTNF